MKVGGNVSISQCPDPFIEQTKSQNSFRARLPMGGGMEGRYPPPAPLPRYDRSQSLPKPVITSILLHGLRYTADTQITIQKWIIS